MTPADTLRIPATPSALDEYLRLRRTDQDAAVAVLIGAKVELGAVGNKPCNALSSSKERSL